MALYDGFFDAVADEESGEYDRAYGSEDFTGYFANVIGSGVCIHNNPNSFKAEYEDGILYLRPGYLFIQGYWLANIPGENEAAEAYKGYAVTLPAGMTGSMAVAAHLNLGQRLIEIEVRPVSQAYPDALVLAIITSSTAEDTRYNTDICGIIDTAGALSNKVEWAVNYIDTEIESKLQQVERDIAAQSAKLDRKIAEVQAVADKIVPPPIGTVKFSAAQNVGEDWLRCDGSFISQEDYPELVQALGRLSPGVEDFSQQYQEQVGQGVSNGVVFAGAHWLFSLGDQALYRCDSTTKTVTSIPVAGTEALENSGASPVWLSITGGFLFLSQYQGAVNTVVLLACSAFTGSESAIAMEALDVAGVITQYTSGIASSDARPSLPGDHFYPEVCQAAYAWDGETADSFIMCLGHDDISVRGSTAAIPFTNLYYIVWRPGQFPAAKISSYAAFAGTNGGSSMYNSMIKTGFRFCHKNSGELVYISTNYYGVQGSSASLKSSPAETYSSSTAVYVQTVSGDDPVANTCVAANNRYLYRCFVQGRRLVVRAGKYNPMTLFSDKDTQPGLTLPSRAQVFPDSVCYAAGQGVWFIFLGTGLAFSQTPEDGASWGYLDTQDTLGVISRFGSLVVDEEKNLLFISGQDTLNHGKLGVLRLPPLFNYANDGAWLPMIASDGVPAYIKATEGGGTVTDPVNMQITVTITGSFASNADIIFNGGVLIAGSYTRTVSAGGTFTVGIRQKSLGGYSYLSLNGTQVASLAPNDAVGTESTVSYNVSDFISGGIALEGRSR